MTAVTGMKTELFQLFPSLYWHTAGWRILASVGGKARVRERWSTTHPPIRPPRRYQLQPTTTHQTPQTTQITTGIRRRVKPLETPGRCLPMLLEALPHPARYANCTATENFRWLDCKASGILRQGLSNHCNCARQNHNSVKSESSKSETAEVNCEKKAVYG